MKKRITALILVVVMLALTLVSCGYSFANDDMTQYANFDKGEFEKAILDLVIEDGEYTTDKEIRAQKILDYVYEILLEKVDTTAKMTEGKVGSRDKFFYCYYVTAEIDGKTHQFLTSSMKESSAVSLQFGNTSTDGYKAKVEAAFKDVELKDVVYTTLTSGTAKADDIAFISYTKSYKEKAADGNMTAAEVTIENEMIVIGDANHDVASGLADKSIATTLDNITKGEGDAKITYSNIKINWVASKLVDKTFVDTTYTEEKKLESATDGKEYDLKDKELTYHVVPVYYLEVEEYNAKTILKTLITTLLHEEDDGHDHEDEDSIYALPSFKDALTEVKDVIAKDEALNGNGLKSTDEGYIQGAKAAYEAAKAAKEKAENALKSVEDEIKKAQDAGKEITDTQKAAKKQAEDALNGNGLAPTAEGYIKGAVKELEEAEAAKTAAETAYDTALNTLITKIGEDKIKDEYEVDIHETLLAEYNEEIRINLATELWALIQKHTKDLTVDNLPAKAVERAYERIYSDLQYNFYKGTFDDGNSSTTNDPSNYSHYSGVFEEYLKAQTKTTTVSDAEAELLKQAKEHVLISVTVFAAAQACDKTLTKDEINELKKPANEYYISIYGEDNVQTQAQFDKLLDFFLETEEEAHETTGVDVYTNIKYTTKKA